MTVADALALPPAPIQLNAYVAVALNAPVEKEPAMARAPLQPPEAVHEVAFVADQVSVDAEPLATLVGLAVSATVGAGGGGTAATVTVVDALALPPAPIQLNAYVAVALNAPVEKEPAMARAPLQPPEAVHEVAFVADQVSVDAEPLTMLVGLAVSVTVGATTLFPLSIALVSPPPQATNAAASNTMPPMHALRYARSVFMGLLSANQCGHGNPERGTRILGQAP